MKIFKRIDATKLPVSFKAEKLLSTATADLVHLHLDPHQAVAPHKNDEDTIFYVLEGEGILTVNGETETLCRGDSVFIEKGAERGWQPAENGDGITLLAVKLH